MEYKLKMFWGSEMTRKVEDMEDEEKKQVSVDDYEVQEYRFDSLAEMKAFIMGIREADGWSASDYIEL
jgi:hypothetical protein